MLARNVHLPVLLLLAFIGASCKNSTGPDAPSAGTTTGWHFTMDCSDLRAGRSNEFYTLWLRLASETSFRRVTTLTVDSRLLHGANQIQLFGNFSSIPDTATINEAIVTVEPDSTATTPGPILMQALNAGADHFLLMSLQPGAVADLAALGGSALFRSSTSDTTRIHHEFYLMQQQGPNNTPSLSSLPNLNTGWIYSVWIVDSLFYPAHKFFYGAFQHPSGHDSDSLNDGYPFPGGYEAPYIQGDAGMIEVSIEPLWQLPNLRKLGNSPFPALEGSLPSHLYSGTVVPLRNVASRGLPNATLILTHN